MLVRMLVRMEGWVFVKLIHQYHLLHPIYLEIAEETVNAGLKNENSINELEQISFK